jgi:hypothetical protein
MGRKRARNRIPMLPEDIKNLLALHSLEAWPEKFATFSRGARTWRWKVVAAGCDHIATHAKFAVWGNRPLEYWMELVKRSNEGWALIGDPEPLTSYRCFTGRSL